MASVDQYKTVAVLVTVRRMSTKRLQVTYHLLENHHQRKRIDLLQNTVVHQQQPLIVQLDRGSLVNMIYDLPDTPAAAQRSPVPLGRKGSDTESKDKAEAEIAISNSVEITNLVKVDMIILQKRGARTEILP